MIPMSPARVVESALCDPLHEPGRSIERSRGLCVALPALHVGSHRFTRHGPLPRAKNLLNLGGHAHRVTPRKGLLVQAGSQHELML